jgi:hypothetical protein
MSYKTLLIFNLSQLASLYACPVEIPMICVCTAPLTPIAHKSELLAFMLGLIALGGFVLIVDFAELELVTVLLLVLFVTIGSAAMAEKDTHQKANTNNPANKLLRNLVDINQRLNSQRLGLLHL